MVDLVTKIWPSKLSKLNIGNKVQGKQMNLCQLEELYICIVKRQHYANENSQNDKATNGECWNECNRHRHTPMTALHADTNILDSHC